MSRNNRAALFPWEKHTRWRARETEERKTETDKRAKRGEARMDKARESERQRDPSIYITAVCLSHLLMAQKRVAVIKGSEIPSRLRVAIPFFIAVPRSVSRSRGAVCARCSLSLSPSSSCLLICSHSVFLWAAPTVRDGIRRFGINCGIYFFFCPVKSPLFLFAPTYLSILLAQPTSPYSIFLSFLFFMHFSFCPIYFSADATA